MTKRVFPNFTQRLIMALLSAIGDSEHADARVVAETLAKEHGVNLPADWAPAR